MDDELEPCPVVSWCIGHDERELERLSWDDIVHFGEPDTLIEFLPDDHNPRPEDLLIERNIVVGRAHEFYFLYGNLAIGVEVDELEQLATKFDLAASRIRALAQTDEVKNARRLKR